MRRLPWHVAIRADRKAVLTAWGIALGVGFSMLSFAVPSALRTEATSPQGPLANASAIIGGDFDPPTFGFSNFTSVAVQRVVLDSGHAVTLAAIGGPTAPELGEGEARTGRLAGALPRTIEFRDAPFRVTGSYEGRGFNPTWVLVPGGFILDPDAQFVVVAGVSDSQVESFRAQGFAVSRAPGIEPFFAHSAEEVARDLLLVVTFSSTLVALFAYKFLRSEVREKRREIALWRGLGMRASHVRQLLLARAATLVGAGIILGLGLAMAVLAVASSGTRVAILVPGLALAPTLALSVAFLVAGMAGAWFPAFSASRATIREGMEAST